MTSIDNNAEESPSAPTVVGFAGGVLATRMPAHRGPVLVDGSGHQVSEVRDAVGGWSFRSTGEPLEPPDERTNHWTKLPTRWSATAGHVLVFAGREETAAAARGAPSAFVRALSGDTPTVPFVRIADDLACAYVSRAERDVYLDWVAEKARAKLFALAKHADREALAMTAFWLQRAARSDQDRALVVAALRAAGDQRADIVRRALFAGRDDAIQDALLKAARVRLDDSLVPEAHLDIRMVSDPKPSQPLRTHSDRPFQDARRASRSILPKTQRAA